MTIQKRSAQTTGNGRPPRNAVNSRDEATEEGSLPYQGGVALLMAFLIRFPLGFLFYKYAIADNEERAAYIQELKDRDAVIEAQAAAKKAERASRETSKLNLNEENSPQEARFKCLSLWDGSMRDLVEAVTKTLRDPSSFEHVQTFASEIKLGGQQYITMSFRARNGFGGLNVAQAKATVRNSDCVIVSWKML